MTGKNKNETNFKLPINFKSNESFKFKIKLVIQRYQIRNSMI